MQVSLVEAIIKLRDDMTPGLVRAQTSLNKFASGATSAASALLPMSAALAVVGGGSIKAAIDFESAFAGIKKTVTATEEEFEMLRNGILEMSSTIPVAATELASIGEAAGQLGIKTENILMFTETMAQLAVTTNLTSQEAAISMARIAAVTKLPQNEFSNLGSAIVFLGNNFETTEAEIVSMTGRLSKAGSVAGLTVAETAGLAASLSSVGIEAEAGGTAMSQIMIKMKNSALDSAEAFKKYADIASNAGPEFDALTEKFGSFQEAAASQEGFGDAMQTVFIGMRKAKEGGANLFKELEKLDIQGIRTTEAALGLVQAGSKMKVAMDGASEAFAKNTALSNEAAQRFITTESKLELLKNQITFTAIKLGDALIPSLTKTVEQFGSLNEKVAGAVTVFSQMPQVVKDTTFGVGALAIALPAILFGLGALASAAGVAATGLGIATSAIVTFTGAVITMAAGSLTAATGGVAAVGAAIYGVFTSASDANLAMDELSASTATNEENNRRNAATIKKNNELRKLAAQLAEAEGEAAKKGGAVVVRAAEEILAAEKKRIMIATVRQEIISEAYQNEYELGESIRLGLIETQKVLESTMEKTGFMLESADEMWKRLDESIIQYREDLPRGVEIRQQFIAEKQLQAAEKERVALVLEIGKALGATQEEIDKVIGKTKKVNEDTFDWGKTLETVSDVFKVMGVSADSWAGKAIAAFTGTADITSQLSGIFGKAKDRAKDLGGTMWSNMKITEKGTVALAGLNTALIAYKSGVLGGAAAGAKFGLQFGPIGAAIGAVAGGLLGLFGSHNKAKEAAKKQAEQLSKLRSEFIKTSGGMGALKASAESAGMTLEKIFNAKTVQEYEDAVNELTDAIELQKQANDALDSAMEKYGITIGDLGETFKQQRMDEMALELWKDYQLLIAAGVDVTLVNEKMADALNEYVQTAIASGATLPETLRPWIEQMIAAGLLLDKNGDKITDINQLKFGESLTEGVKTLVKSIQDLINALLGIPKETNYTVNGTYTKTYKDDGDGEQGPEGPPGLAKGYSGWINRPATFTVGEAGPEYLQVTPKSKAGSSVPGQTSSGSVITFGDINIQANNVQGGRDAAKEFERMITDGRILTLLKKRIVG